MEGNGQIKCATQDIRDFIKNYIASKGVMDCMVGFADVAQVVELYGLDCTYPRAVSFLVPLSRGVLAQLATDRSHALFEQYHQIADMLDDTSAALASYIRAQGFAAQTRPVDEPSKFACQYRPDPCAFLVHTPGAQISHKEVATHAGIGWLGKCGHIVTKPFGSAVVIDSVLTDMPLECSKDVFLSRCGRCQECLFACKDASVSAAGEYSDYIPELARPDAPSVPTNAQNAIKSGEGGGAADPESTPRRSRRYARAQAKKQRRAEKARVEHGLHIPSDREQVVARAINQVLIADAQGQMAETLCGACVYSCPYTKAYLYRNAISLN